ncbi:MAG TPA: ribonuclease D [Cyanobacteria bacterium UBA11149]|nr:ribonuclease D [Cyanobacteria bacterium UBA11367]HBE58140.1 ribonuclease D [Cyanobacteria bacterium UBA11366]HBK66631.1 ribonuclease D [Cyanobacteria bacterium UBA11166]HBR72140.1 ribonuclease D [Cyanobacteria bacterium UBA11159]HBS72653.1 ribonuclease D [Cyanobacteria bacterium UBA11153]HBW89731.1 ribonuclease D [Cyanobacteria bacterium UBA11149]HCA97902.1 ribonuclease D [Cyanobacteria bacterium UBA9226]
MPYLIKDTDIRAAIANCTQAKTLWLDTEVADYQTDKPRLSLIQVLEDASDRKGDRVFILDVLEKPKLVAEFIAEIMVNPAIEKVFHNAQYDLNFLGKKKAKNITCTLELARKIPYYLVPLPNFQLKTLAEHLGDFPSIDKTEQRGNWGYRPLTPNQIDYAKMDAVYLAQVHQRLLQLAYPDPAAEDIEALTLRYRQIEDRWQQLDTEVQQLKERLKAAMQAQNCSQINGFRLSSQTRTTKKVAFKHLVRVTQALGFDLDLSVQLTKEIQQKLGNLMTELPIDEEISTSWRLLIEEWEEQEIPF